MKKKVIFFDNFNVDYYDIAEEELKEQTEDNEKITDSQIYTLAADLESFDFKEACQEIDDILNSYVLLSGYCGRWNGNFYNAAILHNESFEKILSHISKDCDYFKFTLEKGKIEILCTHHDGTNSYTIQNLSEKGINLYNDWINEIKLKNYSEKEFYQKISNSRIYTDKITVNW